MKGVFPEVGGPSASCEYVSLPYILLIKELIWPIVSQETAKQEIQAEIEGNRRWSLGDISSHMKSKM